MWVVTREINQYDQEGEYFVAAFNKKPTTEQLGNLVTRNTEEVVHYLLEDGGGRIRKEDEWWNLHMYNEGESFE